MKYGIPKELQKLNGIYFTAWLVGVAFAATVLATAFSFVGFDSDNSVQMVRLPVRPQTEIIKSSGEEQNIATKFVECREFDIKHLLRNYYDVLSDGDREELSKYVDDVSGFSEEFLRQNIDYVEQYMDIQCYYMEGMMPGTYLVVAYSYAKFYGIGTTVPVINEFYVCSNAHGRYYICMKEVGEEVDAYNRFMFENSQIQEMYAMYKAERENAIRYDSQVKELLEKIQF